MAPFKIFIIFAIVLSFASVNCGYTSSRSGSHGSSDGTGGSYTQSNDNNNERGSYSSTNQQPGDGFSSQTGVGNPYAPGFYGPANFNQNPVSATYSPGYGYNNYNPYYNPNPIFNPFPTGFGSPITPFTPFAPVPSPIEFNQYLNSLQQQYYQFYKQQLDYANAIKNVQAQAYPIPAQGNGYVPNYAYATGAYGANGIHQTAGVFPINKYKPNIDVNNRFNPDDNDIVNPSGQFFGVSTSSFASSADVNGIKMHKEGAVTTVNDNGKVTTYKVDS